MVNGRPGGARSRGLPSRELVLLGKHRPDVGIEAMLRQAQKVGACALDLALCAQMAVIPAKVG